MKTLYIECNAGASGDMILGALTDLLGNREEFGQTIESLGIPGVKVSAETGESKKITGTKIHITVDGIEEGHGKEGHRHAHRRLSDVLGIINGLNVSDRVKKDASEIYAIVAGAESKAHGVPVDLVHFHEVGALDAVADIVGACLLIEKIDPEEIIVSPVRTGYGQVRCAHGTVPVPAPATADILKGIPVYAGDEEGEFCTPTGAAVLRHFADRFQRMPEMVFDGLGCGIGSREFGIANVLRAYLGNTGNVLPSIKEITCDIDDMTPEDLGGIIGLLLESGALDAFIKPCIMKKGRPGFELTCLCKDENLDKLVRTVLAHTSTRGLRVHECTRYAMESRFDSCRTEYGNIGIKISEGFGLRKWKPEYRDILRAADGNGVTVSDVRNAIKYDPDKRNDGD